MYFSLFLFGRNQSCSKVFTYNCIYSSNADLENSNSNNTLIIVETRIAVKIISQIIKKEIMILKVKNEIMSVKKKN
jgi:hypothetical protein